jgi:integrase
LDYEQVADHIHEMKTLSRNGGKVPKGLAWTTGRVALRSWFTVGMEMSGARLSALGVDASMTDGQGSMSHERVTPEVRARFEIEVQKSLGNDYKQKRFDNIRPHLPVEIIGYTKLLYYTATRKQAGLDIMCNNPKHNFEGDTWIINVTDKGKGHNRIEWSKLIYGYAKEAFETYIVKRFGIPPEYIAQELPKRKGYLFPSLQKVNVPKLVKKYLIRAGCVYMKKPKGETTIPIHIWRHTFALDCLEATGWNYELVASLGGWKNTNILKEHYGKMTERAMKEGMMIAMGIKEAKEPRYLKW